MLQRNLFIDQDSASFEELLNHAIKVHNKRISDPSKRIHAFKQQSITLEELLILATGYPDLKKAIFERLIKSHRTKQASFIAQSPVTVNLSGTCAFKALSKQEEIALLYEIMITEPQFALTVFKMKDLWEQIKWVNNFRRRANEGARLMFKIFDFLEKTSSLDYINTYQEYMNLYHFITKAGSFTVNNDRIKLLETIKKLPLTDSVDSTLAKKELSLELKRIKPSFLTYLIADMLKDTLIAPGYFTRKCETYHASNFLERVLTSSKELCKGNKPIKTTPKHRIFIEKHYEPQQRLRITMTGSSSEDESTEVDKNSSAYAERPNKLGNNRYTNFASKPQPIPKVKVNDDINCRRYAKSC